MQCFLNAKIFMYGISGHLTADVQLTCHLSARVHESSICHILLRSAEHMQTVIMSRVYKYNIEAHMFCLQVAVIVDGVTKKAAEIATVKDDAERDLAAAKPALDAALSALNSITQKDIVGLKALKNPPDIVKRIFDAVLLLRCPFVAACLATGTTTHTQPTVFLRSIPASMLLNSLCCSKNLTLLMCCTCVWVTCHAS